MFLMKPFPRVPLLPKALESQDAGSGSFFSCPAACPAPAQLPFPPQMLWAALFLALGPQQWDKLFGKADLLLAKISPDCAVSK